MTDRHGNHIAGEWVAGAGEVENRNPSDVSDLIGLYAQADAGQLDRAIEAARAAQRDWAKVGPEKRQAALLAIGQELMSRAAELGRPLSREQGGYAKEFYTTVKTAYIAAGQPA